jgi:hypothetical protein
MDTQRDISFLLRHLRGVRDPRKPCGISCAFEPDVPHHVSVRQDQLLMDSTGFINIDRTDHQDILYRSRGLSASTLVASIYGMN